MNEDKPLPEKTTTSGVQFPAVGGGILFGLGVAAWLAVTPLALLAAVMSGTTDPTTNGIVTVWLGVYAALSGAGVAMVVSSLGTSRRAARVLLAVYVVLLLIGVGARVWFAVLEGAPPTSCEVPPCN
jgi:hypothetical protein